ncbi:TadE/TadG family type IV pilus assembly protein [Pseudooceanicola aestuarii]|uniref:TadE/TadG family type IV pilus assembly protein n=1 Tax=Pseudooceanicola aestuarii TaxID=2697319 RepID=UPI0013D2E952|nr:TadE/TadG family type IV pilus assembly protein [Pseudooceanicola aestuarii]
MVNNTKKLKRQGAGPRPRRAAVVSRLVGFARDENGVMVPLTLFLFLIMLIGGGMAYDFMRFEMERVRLQAVMDRALLAAANTKNDLEPKEIVKDYFAKADMASYLDPDDISVINRAGYRRVEAQANKQISTQFIGQVGVDVLDVSARGIAEESIGNAEVSLVLDISGSMGRSSRLSNMRTAAKEFVDTVIKEDTEDLVSVSLVTYSSQVNPGRDIMTRLNVTQLHDYSHCIEFKDSDFDTTAISPDTSYTQFPFFADNYDTGGYIDSPECPDESFEEIVPFSQSTAKLKDVIGDLQARENTSIHLGMKWGVGLLDPAFQPIIQSMAEADDNGGSELVPDVFADRPTAWTAGALKTVVLMTDGENVKTIRIRDEAYETPSMRYHWAYNELSSWLDEHVDEDKHDDYYRTAYTADEGDDLLDRICTEAKKKGIIVWTIGFEVNNDGADVMEDCASSPAHFYRVEGIELSEAFGSIARQLNQLRLIQ